MIALVIYDTPLETALLPLSKLHVVSEINVILLRLTLWPSSKLTKFVRYYFFEKKNIWNMFCAYFLRVAHADIGYVYKT